MHLVRAGNDPAALQRFVASYREHPAGVDHELVVVYKGFPDEAGKAAARAALEGVAHLTLDVDDTGFDIAAYQQAVMRLPHDCFCFCNSFSEILAPGWLEMLHRHAAREDVGIAGCTGSYQSNFSPLLWHYADAVRRLRAERAAAARGSPWPWVGWPQALASMPPYRRWRYFVGLPIRALPYWPEWPAFPNYHVRTNSFMIRRDIATRVRWPATPTKVDAYKFESGRRSLTRQVTTTGLRAVVVGRDGRAYDLDAWRESETFWTGDQANLLVADNQTRDYACGDAARRAELKGHAWGRRASRRSSAR